MTDGELLERLERDPEEGMRALVERYGVYAFAVARRVLGKNGSWQDAEDCAAEAFAAVYRARAEIDPEKGSVRAYLAGAARNRAKMLLRYQARHQALELTEDVAGRDEDGKLWELVAQLPERDGKLILRRYRDGFSMEEIAREAGIGCAAARKRISRALERLRRLAREAFT